MPNQQREFLDKTLQASGLSPSTLADMAKVHPRSFLDWRREKLRMSVEAVDLFIQKFQVLLPEKKEVLIQRWRESQKNAAKIGGTIRYQKYGPFATKEGRKKGGRKTMIILRERGLIPQRRHFLHPSMSVQFSEFVGIMLGGGGIRATQITITLNSEADKKYISFVSKLLKTLFGATPGIHKRKTEKATVLYFNGIELIEFLLKMGLKTGNKVKQQVGIPEWILKRKDYKTACVRGLMDTDGGVFVHSYKVGGKMYSYHKICFTNKSVPLLVFVFNTLEELGFHPKFSKGIENNKVWLYNATEVQNYLHIVSSHNYRLLRYFKEASHSLVH